MEVILLERIKGLGLTGSIVKVKDGYARNYLLIRNKALRATEENKKIFSEQKHAIEAQQLERLQDAKVVYSKLENKMATIIRQAGEAGHLYGSVTPKDVVVSIKSLGVDLDKSQILLSKPIKNVGIHTIEVSLHSELHIELKLNIARSDEEATKQELMHNKKQSKEEAKKEADSAVESAKASTEEKAAN